MPLIQGKSDNSRSKNIAELINAGHSPAQSEAIAYKEQREAKAKAKDNESARKSDLNDFMEIKGNPISKVGVFPYAGFQIGSPELEPDKIYMVYRPEASLNEPQAIESFKLIPFTDEHAMLGSEDGMTPAEEKGVHGVIGEDVYYEAPYLKANIKVFSEKLKGLINDGKKELSIGYRCLYEYNPGVYNGESYDFIQKEIRGNHLALVEEGRSGHDVSVMDKYKFTYDSLKLINPEKQQMEPENEEMSLEQCFKMIKELAEKVKSMSKDEDPEMEEMDEENPELSEKAAMQGDVEPDDFVKKANIEDDDEDPSEMEAKSKEKNMMKKEQGEDEDEGEEEKKEGDYSKPKDKSMDSQLKSLLGEISNRNSLANKLSKVIGVFDHANKTTAEVAQYGIKKLGLTAKKGHEESVLQGYLAAVKTNPVAINAQDSNVKSKGIDAYLKGVK